MDSTSAQPPTRYLKGNARLNSWKYRRRVTNWIVRHPSANRDHVIFRASPHFTLATNPRHYTGIDSNRWNTANQVCSSASEVLIKYHFHSNIPPADCCWLFSMTWHILFALASCWQSCRWTQSTQRNHRCSLIQEHFSLLDRSVLGNFL